MIEFNFIYKTKHLINLIKKSEQGSKSEQETQKKRIIKFNLYCIDGPHFWVIVVRKKMTPCVKMSLANLLKFFIKKFRIIC